MPTDRIKVPELLSKVMDAKSAAAFIQDQMVVGASGFTKAGDSKAVLPALADRAKRGKYKK